MCSCWWPRCPQGSRVSAQNCLPGGEPLRQCQAQQTLIGDDGQGFQAAACPVDDMHLASFYCGKNSMQEALQQGIDDGDGLYLAHFVEFLEQEAFSSCSLTEAVDLLMGPEGRLRQALLTDTALTTLAIAQPQMYTTINFQYVSVNHVGVIEPTHAQSLEYLHAMGVGDLEVAQLLDCFQQILDLTPRLSGSENTSVDDQNLILLLT